MPGSLGGRVEEAVLEATTQPIVQKMERDVHSESVKLEFPELVISLVAIIGKKLTAYIASVKDIRTVEGWMKGTLPYNGPDTRLRVAHYVAKLISLREKPSVVQSWMMGLNPQLNDRAAATMLREGDVQVVGPEVLRAARAFVSGG